MKSRGISIIEMLIYMFIISIVFVLGIRSFKAFKREAEISNAVRMVISSLNTARYKAVSDYDKIRVFQDNNKIFLQKKINNDWKSFSDFIIKGNITVKFNNFPVFSPLGSASPLCSILISSEYKKFKTTLSMAGRIKTKQI